jgi:Arc/MetJ-type ribon-helix-helix transcriptional regulator
MNNLNQKKFTSVVRATFSLPYEATEEIEQLRKKFGRSGSPLNKSEVVRIGLAALKSLDKSKLQEAADRIVKLKAGRPRVEN